MLQAAPQFSPLQLLDAGRRAEAEGNVDAAFQFYRRTVDQYAYTAEAAEAFDGLVRLKARWRPQARRLKVAPPPAEPAAKDSGDAAPARKVWRSKYPAPRNYYRAGKTLAQIVSAAGWLIVTGGLAVAPLYYFLGQPAIVIGQFGILGAALLVAVFGLITAALGQATRALFDQANATRELVAIERAKSGWEDA